MGRTAAAELGALRIPCTQERLDNGLTVLLHPDDRLPQVVVNVWYEVGARDEDPGRTGFAHLFEHLMFMGTERAPRGSFDVLMEAWGGWNNAWTSEDATDYYDCGPSNLLNTLLWLEADRMDGLGRAITQEKLDLQRDVVRNERRQSYEDEPYGQVWLELPGALFPNGHPYAHPVIGSHEDLEAATLDDVRGFFSTWYVPDNAVLTVAGDFEPAAALDRVRALFSHARGRCARTRRFARRPESAVHPEVELRDRVEVPQTLLAWTTAAQYAPGDAECDVLASILGEGRASRLYRRLVHEEQRALSVRAWQMSMGLCSVFGIEARPAPGHGLEELEQAILEEISELSAKGPTEEEVERAVNRYEMGFLRRMETLESRAASLARYQAGLGQPDGAALDLGRYLRIGPADLKAVAAALSPYSGTRVRVRPEGS